MGAVEVFREAGRFAGFVVTVDSGAAFDSGNFAWFTERYDVFTYLDRIVVHEGARRLGLAGRVYDEVEARTALVALLLTLEVNVDPPNDVSLAFHAGRGFEQVGERVIDDHTVGMLVERLTKGGQPSGSSIPWSSTRPASRARWWDPSPSTWSSTVSWATRLPTAYSAVIAMPPWSWIASWPTWRAPLLLVARPGTPRR